MKKLFCLVFTDESGEVGLVSPFIFHVKCNESSQAEEESIRILKEENGYTEEEINLLDMFYFEVTDSDIIEL